MKPRIGITLGDPTGIGPEIVAKLLAQVDFSGLADLIVIGDRRILEMGAQIAGADLDVPAVTSSAELPANASLILLDIPAMAPDDVPLGQVSAEAGEAVVQMRTASYQLIRDEIIQALVNAPTNKEAIMRAGHAWGGIGELAQEVGWSGPRGELNVLGDLWTSRVTSHVPMADVHNLLTQAKVLEAIELIHGDLAASGATPRIAVAAYNPHSGEGGLVGREEIEVIAPAIKDAQAKGLDAQGPFPADTIFPMAMERGYNAVVTMYHDQGQIAMKLLGFHRGVTVSGGLPVPITTPAHGTAHDIAGKGVADPSALEAALRLAINMIRGKGS